MGKAVRLIVAIPFITLFPVALVILAAIPVMGILSIAKIMQSGFAVPNKLLIMLNFVLFFVLFSLQLRYVRKIYLIFPFLLKLVEFLTMVSTFVVISVLFLNWRYEIIEPVRITLGNIGAVVILLLGRAFLSVYYYRNPMVLTDRYQRY